MTQHKKSIVSELRALPWWKGMMVAAAMFVGLRWVAPLMFGNSIAGNSVASAMVSISGVFGVMFVVAMGAAWIRAVIARQGRRSIDSLQQSPQQKIVPTGEARPKPIPATTPLSPPRIENIHPDPRARTARWTPELLRELDWKRFEAVTVALFQELGFCTETIDSRAGGGVDIYLYQPDSDAAALVVQCKSLGARDASIRTVWELARAMTRENINDGIFSATGGFADDAMRFASCRSV